MTDFLEKFQDNPARGVVTTVRLACWRELLEEWCNLHERYCRVVKGDAMFWYHKRQAIGVLAAAAWRMGWVALEEFVNNGKSVDLFMKSAASEDCVKSFYPDVCWNNKTTTFPTDPVAKGIKDACNVAQNYCPATDTGRIGVVFAAPIFLQSNPPTPDLVDALAKFAKTIDGEDLDAVAWCFPWLKGPVKEGKYVWSGLFLFAKLAS